MSVMNRKLFNREARDELRRKGGIMASSEPMMQAAGYENGGQITREDILRFLAQGPVSGNPSGARKTIDTLLYPARYSGQDQSGYTYNRPPDIDSPMTVSTKGPSGVISQSRPEKYYRGLVRDGVQEGSKLSGLLGSPDPGEVGSLTGRFDIPLSEIIDATAYSSLFGDRGSVARDLSLRAAKFLESDTSIPREQIYGANPQVTGSDTAFETISQVTEPPSYLYVNIPGVTPNPVLMTERDFERFEKMYPDAARSSESTVIDVASLDSRVDISNIPIVTSLDSTSGSRKDAVEKTKKTTTNVNTPPPSVLSNNQELPYNPATTVIDYDPTNVDQAALQLRAEQKANEELYTDRLRIENQIKRLEESAITIDDFERLKVLKAQLESMGGSTDQNPVTAQLKQAEANFGKLIKQDQDTAQISPTARDLVVAKETVNQLKETLKLADSENKPVIQNRLENANDALVVAEAAYNNAKLEQTSEFPTDERLAPQANERRDDDPDLSELITSTPKAPDKPKFPTLDQFIEVQGGKDKREIQTNADELLDNATKDFKEVKTDDEFDDEFDKYVSRFSKILGGDEEEKKRNTGFALAMYGATYATTGNAGEAAQNMIEMLRGDAATRQARKDKIKMLALNFVSEQELAKAKRQTSFDDAIELYTAKMKIKELYDDPKGFLESADGRAALQIFLDVTGDENLNEEQKLPKLTGPLVQRLLREFPGIGGYYPIGTDQTKQGEGGNQGDPKRQNFMKDL